MKEVYCKDAARCVLFANIEYSMLTPSPLLPLEKEMGVKLFLVHPTSTLLFFLRAQQHARQFFTCRQAVAQFVDAVFPQRGVTVANCDATQ